MKIAFSLQVYHHRPQRVRSRHSPQPLQNLIPLMDPQKAPQGTPRGGPQALPESPRDHQAPSRAPLQMPLEPPRPPTNPPKTLSRCFESFQNAKEGAQSLPNATQEAPKPQSTLKSMKIKRFSYYTWLIHQGSQTPLGCPQGQASRHLGTCKNYPERQWRRPCVARERPGTSKNACRLPGRAPSVNKKYRSIENASQAVPKLQNAFKIQ